MKICIVIPMYNEESIAKQSIETINSYVKDLPEIATILVVNDGSVDATESIVRKTIVDLGNDNLLLFCHPVNQGYGAALRSGIEFAIAGNFDYVLFMDSDLTNHPKYLIKFYEKMVDGYDYIKASRYTKGAETICVPLFHRILSFAGNFLAKILYGLPLTDFTNGFRAVRVGLLKETDLHESGFSIIMEELYQVKPLTQSFCEIPYALSSRGKGQSRSKFSYGPGTCLRYLKYPVKSFLRSLKLYGYEKNKNIIN